MRAIALLLLAFFSGLQVSAKRLPKDSLAYFYAAAIREKASIQQVNDLNSIANNYLSRYLDSVKIIALQTLSIATKLEYTKGQADALLNLTFYYENKPNLSEGVATGLQCIDKYKLANDQTGLARAYIEQGMLFKKIGGDKLLEEYMRTSVRYAMTAFGVATANNDTANMIDALNQAGISYRDWGKLDGKGFYYDSAFQCFEQAIQLTANSPTFQADQMGRLYNNISQVYTEYKHDYQKALEYLFKAVEHNKRFNRYAALSYNYGNISEVYLLMNDQRQALNYARMMLEVVREMNLPHRLLNAYSQLYLTYEKMGRFDSALFYHKLKVDIGDSLLDVEKTRQIADMQTKYETAEKEIAINGLSASNKVKTKNIYILLVCLVLVAAFATAMILLYRQVKKQKQQLQQQSDKLQWMMRELHHRVKNNMQIVTSLLNLQTYRIKDEASVAALTESKLRVQAMSLIHQRLYQSEDVSLVNFRLFIIDLTETLMAAYGYSTDDFDLHISIEEEMLDVDAVLPLGLMVNEILTNSFKYAYQYVQRPGLRIVLNRSGQQLTLDISDNGPGNRLVDAAETKKGFGKSLIDAFIKQLHATCNIETSNGMAYHFTIPYKKQKAA